MRIFLAGLHGITIARVNATALEQCRFSATIGCHIQLESNIATPIHVAVTTRWLCNHMTVRISTQLHHHPVLTQTTNHYFTEVEHLFAIQNKLSRGDDLF